MTNINSPLVLFVYRRPNYTSEILKIIEKIEFDNLYVVADGPKKPQEKDITEKVRNEVCESNIDANIYKNYSEKNLGLRKRFASGLEWVFSNEDRAIILEDDIRPNISFFKFCDTLLDYYEGDNRIWDITGVNHIGKWCVNDFSYHFSYHGSMWGWATWKDSWKKYDKNMKKWDYEISKQAIKNVLCNRRQYEYVKKVYEKTFNKEIDTWDYQWGFTRQVNNGLSVVPSVNLVKNVGVGSRATNTYTSNTLMPKNSFEIKTPLRHPFFVAPDRDYDGRVHNLRSQSSLYNFLQKAISIISS